MMRRPRSRPRHAEHGASLIMVLFIVTVVSVVLGAVLSQADTNVRATVALRDQASNNYGADGAAEAVLNQIGSGASGINCADPNNPAGVSLGTVNSPFYSPVSSQQGPLNAYAKCSADALQGVQTSTSQPPPTTSVSTVTPAPVTSTATYLGQGDPTLPSYALLTTGTASGDYGIDFSQSANNKTVCVQNGSVASNTNINATGSTLAVRLDPTTTGSGTSDCTTGTGSVSGSTLVVNAANPHTTTTGCLGGANAYKPTACKDQQGTVPTPPDPALPGPIAATNPAPACLAPKGGGNTGTTYVALYPGLYTDPSILSTPCNTSSNNSVTEWMQPGAYYFNFPSGSQWIWPTLLVGGTPVDTSGNALAVNAANPSSLANLANVGSGSAPCADPINSGVNGVQMVFAGSSTAKANSSGRAVICASSASNAPPLAIWGLESAQTVAQASGGSVTLPAETLCSSTGCGTSSIITTAQDGQPQIYIKGYVYAPQGAMYLTLKNSTGQVFNWGIVVRDFGLFINGVSPTQAFISLPKPNTGVGVVTTTSTPPPYPTTSVTTPPPTTITSYTLRYINVWMCTVAYLRSSGATTCPTNGNPNVQVRVLTDSSGHPVKVLSWSQIR